MILEHYQIPSMVQKATLQKIFSKVSILPRSAIFNSEDPQCIIGYIASDEKNCLKFNNLIPNSEVAANMIKDQLIHKCSYTKKSACDNLLDINVSKFGEVNDLVINKFEDALVVCCIDVKHNPFKYSIFKEGPLHCEKRSSRSSDVLSFGPLFTPLHVDVDYGNRTSLIPSWNVGTKKLWFIRRKADSRTQKLVNPTKHKCTPEEQLQTILSESDEYILLIQEPGDIIRHIGQHYHLVMTIIDNNSLNPSGICVSIGKIDIDVHDKKTYVRRLSVPVVANEDGSLRTVSKETFIKTQLNKKEATALLKEIDKVKKRKRCATRGFAKGNKLACHKR